MRNSHKLLRHCALLALALLLVAGALALPGPGVKPPKGIRPWLQIQGGSGGGGASGSSGVLMVLNLAGPGNSGYQGGQGGTRVLTDLARLGAQQGDPLDGSRILVRLPSDKLSAAQKAAGSALEAYQPSGRVSPSLQAVLGAAQNGTARCGTLLLDVTLFDPGDRGIVAAAVQGCGGKVLQGESGEGRVLRLQLPAGRLANLAGLPEVVYIEPVQAYSLMNDRTRDIVGATPLEANGWLGAGIGLSGSGQIVGLADSGLDRGSSSEIHPDLASRPGAMPKVVMLKSWAGAAVADDPNGHGTHMAATIAGTGAASNGRYQGLAPGASIYFQGLIDAQGRLDPPPDLATLFEPAYEAGVRIHVDGWGGDTGGYFSSASQTDRFIREHPDFLVIFSAGNKGPGAGALTPEAYTKNGLVVGASQSPHPLFDPQQVDSSSPCDFSSRGPTGDGRLKPDLLAPGALISARASQVASEFDLGDYYTYMEGTSMAAAVAGGSAALLREYLQRYEQVARPSAALLKAALINGAAPIGHQAASGPNSDGFGVLDLGGTILALHQKTFAFIDSSTGVAAGGTNTYTYQAPGGDAPFKATLAWTDPAAAPGSAHPLVNNLDLVVRDPSGKLWPGNSFLYPGKADDVNNVEQVFIPQPMAGTYTIYVKGTDISQNVVPGQPVRHQDFALVFGQPLVRDIVVSASGQVTLNSGREIKLDQARVSYEEDGQVVVWPAGRAGSLQARAAGGDRLCGADIYLPPAVTGSPEYAYLAGRTWQAGGIQVVATGSILICTEINPASRTGGFTLAVGADSRFLVNGRKLSQPAELSPGGEIRANINPGTQTLWQAEVDYLEVIGYLDRVDQAQGELWLIGHPQPYDLAPQAALAYLDHLTAADPSDLPFAAGAVPEWDKLLPGLKLELMIAPESGASSQAAGAVMYVGAQRQLAVGTITGVHPDTGTVVLSSGRSYNVSRGVLLQLDQQDAKMGDLQPGQLAIVLLAPESQQVLSLAAYSQVLYGRVVYASAKQQTLYLVDSTNEFHVINLSSATQVFRWGLPSGMNSIEPGAWVRLCLDPKTGEAWFLDVAETLPERTEVFSSFDPVTQTLYTDRAAYRVAGSTLVTKNGFQVAPADLVAGEGLTLAPLLTEVDGKPLLAVVTARTRAGVAPPRLEVAAPWHGEYVTLSCFTTADRLYAYLPGQIRQSVPVVKGRSFQYSFLPPAAPAMGAGGQQELVVRLVALDTVTGGVTGQSVTIPPRSTAVLGDLDGCWASADVEALLAQHLISGYPDGTFRPEQPITRAEFAVLLSGALGWTDGSYPIAVKDARAIPVWARAAVSCCLHYGLFRGEGDGCFHPDQPVTRAEAAVLLDKALQVFSAGAGGEAVSQPGWQDWPQVPVWARASVERIFKAGIMSGRTAQEFAPDAPLKREEAATAVNRLLENLRHGQ